METIPKADCKNIGFFRKTHGINGGLILEFEPHFEFSVEDATRFFVELDGLLVPFFVSDQGLRIKSGNSAIVKLDWVDSENYAKRLIGKTVYLFLEEIVDEEDENVESIFQDYVLFDSIHGKIGQVIQVDDFAGNVVFTVKTDEDELLIPFNEDLVKDMNEAEKTIILELPEGLINS